MKIIKEYIPYTKNVEITEKRAPTDESVKLLNQMQGEAVSNLVEKGFVVLKNCGFEFRYYKIVEPFSGDIRCILSAKVNGLKFNHEYKHGMLDKEDSKFAENIGVLFRKIIAENMEVIVSQ